MALALTRQPGDLLDIIMPDGRVVEILYARQTGRHHILLAVTAPDDVTVVRREAKHKKPAQLSTEVKP